MVILDVEGIRALDLEGRIPEFLKKSQLHTRKHYKTLEEALQEDIKEMASETGLEPNLLNHLTHLYHSKKLSPKDIVEYFPDDLDIGVVDHTINGWMRRLSIPKRNFAEAREVEVQKKRLGLKHNYLGTGLSRREYQVLACAAMSMNMQKTGALLAISPYTVRNHRSSMLSKIFIARKPRHHIRNAIIVGHWRNLYSRERLEVAFEQELQDNDYIAESIEKLSTTL